MFLFCSQKTLINSRKNAKYEEIMKKMRIFKFWNESGDEKEKEAMSLKKAVMSVQGDFKDKIIGVEYISKKGKEMCHYVAIPVGRKIKQALIQERRREALKNASR